MAKVKLTIDDKEYTEDQFQRDLVRMFDTYRDSDWMGSPSCYGVDCGDCPLGDKTNTAVCSVTKAKAFDLIKSVHDWAKEKPIITNFDKLKETFGKDVVHYIESRPYKEKWLDEEYKEPKGESKNDD